MMNVKYRGRGGCDREHDGLQEIFKFTEVRLGTRCKFLFHLLLTFQCLSWIGNTSK
jgi:hypothetical protein